MGVKYDRHGAAVYRSKRWAAVRLSAKRRDGFRCVQCGARGRLEVDHIRPLRTHPELAFELANLQALCVPCHSRKTHKEIGLGQDNPAREAWKRLVAAMQPNPRKERKCSNP